MPDTSGELRDQVVAFYDAHPINEQQILNTLANKGVSETDLTEEILKDHDQDHFGGLEANDILTAKAGIRPEHRVQRSHLRAACRDLQAKGVRFKTEPVEITAGPNQGGLVVYFFDPDGYTLEMFQPP